MNGFSFFSALFVAAWCLATFLPAPATRGGGGRRLHTIWLLAGHLLALLPVAGLVAPAAGLLTAAAHLGLDALLSRGRRTRGDRLGPSVLSLALHLGLAALAASLLAALVARGMTLSLHGPIDPERLRLGAWAVACITFQIHGAARLVRGVLQYLPVPNALLEPAGSGRIIGILERLLVFPLVLLDQWGALGLVLAAKSIARFKDLDQRLPAEYYLVGTLTSLLCAVLGALLLRGLVP